ncbi:MAG: hypothetical protein L6Q38_04130 [Nitrospira sp.]|nr:hypothetical protein [Nitrospira sp.]
MGRPILALYLGRRWGCLLSGTRRMFVRGQALSLSAEIAPGSPIEMALSDLLGRIPAEWRGGDLRIALSPALLGCADTLESPFQTEKQVSAVVESLAEERCAGENAEDLTVDFALNGKIAGKATIEVVALRTALLRSLLETVHARLPAATVSLITSAPAVLKRALVPKEIEGGLALLLPGEVFESGSEGDGLPIFRAFPVAALREGIQDRVAARIQADETAARFLCAWDPDHRVKLKAGIECPVAHAIPTALALTDPETLPNLVSRLPEHSNGSRHLRKAYLGVLAAAAMLLLVAGLYFDRKAKHVSERLDACSEIEASLWKTYLPHTRFVPDALAERMRAELELHRKATEANRLPSALAFWGQVGRRMPAPDKIGFSLDELSFAPDGGRLAGRVKAEPGDPLRNAALLERALNESEALDARGEFESRGDEIVVRVRLDYRPQL